MHPGRVGYRESTEGITFPSDIQGLGALLTRGNNSIKTAHLQLTESAAGQTITAHGDEELSNGTVKSIDLSETVNSLDLRFIIIGTKVYAQLPAAVYQSPSRGSRSARRPPTRRCDSSTRRFETSIQTGAGKSIGSLVSAGKDLSFKGKEQVGGVTVGHYELNVDVNTLPTDFPNRDALLQTGLTKLSGRCLRRSGGPSPQGDRTRHRERPTGRRARHADQYRRAGAHRSATGRSGRTSVSDACGANQKSRAPAGAKRSTTGPSAASVPEEPA